VILIAGLTPAWQQILIFEKVQWGEVNRAEQSVWCASGKVFNAALAAYHLGGPVRLLATVGGRTRRQIEDDFELLELDYRWVVTEAPTRVCTTILDRGRGQVTELVEGARPLTQSELEQFRQAYLEEVAKASAALLIGSLPEGTPREFFRELLAETRCPAVLDFRGQSLEACLDLRPLVVKPNRRELGETLRTDIPSPEAIPAAIRELQRRGAQWVIVTDGDRAVWVGGPKELLRFLPPKPAEVVNPIGSGDALAGTLAMAIGEGKSIPEAVQLGIGAAVHNVEQLVPCRLKRERVFELAKQVTGEVIQRQ